jgi:ribulose-5-phosphate 4-epimerase/fuculose-1-phosphate aldolase
VTTSESGLWAGSGPAWADAGIICPWAIYDIYGDRRQLAAHYPAMVRQIEWYRRTSRPNLLPPSSYKCLGDWLNHDAPIPNDVFRTAFFAYSAGLVARVTSEFNSHLAVHNDQIARSGTNFHALIHAQPPHLTYLSQIPAYRDQAIINQRLLRWEPETIVNLPEGIGVLPYRLPGSPAMMEANLQGLRAYRIVLWSKHGVMARSDQSVTKAADRIEYAETAALYEYMDLVNGSQAEGLTVDELREVVRAFDVPTTLV